MQGEVALREHARRGSLRGLANGSPLSPPAPAAAAS